MYDSCYTNREKNVSRNNYLKLWIRNSHVKNIDRKYWLFCRYKAELVSFENYNGYKIYWSNMLRGTKDNYFQNRFNDAIDNTSKTRLLLKDLVNNGRVGTCIATGKGVPHLL